jgi:hypothetical protein
MIEVSYADAKTLRGGPRDVLSQPNFLLEDQLAARMLTLPSASEVSFWSVAFSSSNVFGRAASPTQSGWRQCSAGDTALTGWRRGCSWCRQKGAMEHPEQSAICNRRTGRLEYWLQGHM